MFQFKKGREESVFLPVHLFLFVCGILLYETIAVYFPPGNRCVPTTTYFLSGSDLFRSVIYRKVQPFQVYGLSQLLLLCNLYPNALHYLGLYRAIGIIGAHGGDLIYHIQTLSDLAESCISTV